jgi:hypothetical protein
VATELAETGLLTDKLSRVCVVLQGFTAGRAVGWFIERPGWLERLRGLGANTIQIPRTSLARLLARLTGGRRSGCSLRANVVGRQVLDLVRVADLRVEAGTLHLALALKGIEVPAAEASTAACG